MSRFTLQPRPPPILKESPGLLAQGPESVRDCLGTISKKTVSGVSFQTPETVSDTFWTPGSETLSGFLAWRARKTPAKGGRVCKLHPPIFHETIRGCHRGKCQEIPGEVLLLLCPQGMKLENISRQFSRHCLSIPKHRNRRKIAAFSNRKAQNRKLCRRNRRKMARKSQKKSVKICLGCRKSRRVSVFSKPQRLRDAKAMAWFPLHLIHPKCPPRRGKLVYLPGIWAPGKH